MNPWFNLFQLPFGQFDQNVNPVTTWFSPRYTLNFQGDAEIEETVQREVASFGKQLGVLTDALVELAGSQQGQSLERLRQLQQEVEAVKQKHRKALLAKVKDDLASLKTEQPEAYQALLKDLSSGG